MSLTLLLDELLNALLALLSDGRERSWIGRDDVKRLLVFYCSGWMGKEEWRDLLSFKWAIVKVIGGFMRFRALNWIQRYQISNFEAKISWKQPLLNPIPLQKVLNQKSSLSHRKDSFLTLIKRKKSKKFTRSVVINRNKHTTRSLKIKK